LLSMNRCPARSQRTVTTYSDTRGSSSAAAQPPEQRGERGAPLDPIGGHRIVIALMDVTPTPRLAARERHNPRVTGLVEMLERVRMFGILAASDMAADEAHAKLRPRRADREAILASAARRRHGLHVAEVLAEFVHVRVPRPPK